MQQFLSFSCIWRNKLTIEHFILISIDWGGTIPSVFVFHKRWNIHVYPCKGLEKQNGMNSSDDSLHVFTAKGTRVNCRPEKGQFISSVPVDHAEGARARLRICIEGRRRNWHSYLTTWASICPFRYCEMHAFPSRSSSTHAVKLFKNLISAPPSLFFGCCVACGARGRLTCFWRRRNVCARNWYLARYRPHQKLRRPYAGWLGERRSAERASRSCDLMPGRWRRMSCRAAGKMFLSPNKARQMIKEMPLSLGEMYGRARTIWLLFDEKGDLRLTPEIGTLFDIGWVLSLLQNSRGKMQNTIEFWSNSNIQRSSLFCESKS